MDKQLLTVLSAIPKLDKGQRFFLGIDGLSRSGKTTFVKTLHEHFNTIDIPVKVLHIDDFIVERNKRYHTGKEEWFEYYFLQWDVTWLKENLFAKIKNSANLNLPFYDNLSDTHIQKKITIPETCLVIFEGVFLQRSEWKHYFDLTVYLQCPRETRYSRESVSTQENIKKFENRYWKAEDYYIQTVNPERLADIVLKN